MSTTIYPQRIEFLNRGKCSVCDSLTQKIVNTNLSHFFGWTSCNKKDCDEKIKQSYNETTIDIDTLIKKYGKKITIARSNLTLEHDWEFDSNASKEVEDGPYWVFVKNISQNKRKEVTLYSIDELNKVLK